MTVRGLTIVVLGLWLAGCASVPQPDVPDSTATTQVVQPDNSAIDPPNNNLYATLYLRQAAEYKALTHSIFAGATAQLDAALAADSAALEQGEGFESLPPGIIFDVDETVLDNSAYQGTLVAEDIEYNTPHWDRWVADAEAEALPGAVAFSRVAVERGVTMLYLTNRRCIQREPGGDPCPQRAETIANLISTGFPEPDPANVYLRSPEFDMDREKGSRRAAFAERYRIIMLFGDDLGDFVDGVKQPGMQPDQRAAVVAKHGERWGRQWFILPNPSYGSWLDTLEEPLYQHLDAWRDDGN